MMAFHLDEVIHESYYVLSMMDKKNAVFLIMNLALFSFRKSYHTCNVFYLYLNYILTCVDKTTAKNKHNFQSTLKGFCWTDFTVHQSMYV